MQQSSGVQLEESVCNLQHEDVRVVVLMADEDAFACSSHSILFIMLFKSF